MFRDFGIGSTERYHRRCLRVVRYARQFFKEPRTFSGQTAWCDAKRKSKLYVPSLVPDRLPFVTPLRFRYSRHARGALASARVSSWRAEELIHTDRLRLNTPTPAYAHNIDVHPPESYMCRNVACPFLSSYGDSPRYYTTRRIDNHREITLYLPANWLIPMKCEIPVLGEDIYRFAVSMASCTSGKRPKEFPFRGFGEGELVKRFNVRINVLIITQPWQFDYRCSNCIQVKRSLFFNHKCIKRHAVGEFFPVVYLPTLSFLSSPGSSLLYIPSYINYHGLNDFRSLITNAQSVALPECLCRATLLSSWEFFRPWLLSIHGALIDPTLRSQLIWLVSGGRAPIHAHASQRSAMLLSAFLLIAGCRQRYPPPRFWCGRTSKWRSLTERESLRFSIY